MSAADDLCPVATVYAAMGDRPTLSKPVPADVLAVLVEALALAQRMNREALPKFNWSASALDACAIDLLNRAPMAVDAALDRVQRGAT